MHSLAACMYLGWRDHEDGVLYNGAGLIHYETCDGRNQYRECDDDYYYYYKAGTLHGGETTQTGEK